MRKRYSWTWADNWYIENGTAWFVAGESNILFQVDMKTGRCDFVAQIPESKENGARLNPKCIKCNNDIFCMPDLGNDIWVYQLEHQQFQQIEINNPDHVRLAIGDFWRDNDRIFAVSRGLKEIIEIRIEEKTIENCYTLSNMEDTIIGRSTKVGRKIYSVSAAPSQIYEFDTETKALRVYTLPNIERYFWTISFDGKDFWLSGTHKEIYVWNKESNTVKIMDKFPQQFGIYHRLENGELEIDRQTVMYDAWAFFDCIVTEQYVWLIPFQTNEILYVNKDTYEIQIFPMEDEDETSASLYGRGFEHKYLVEYVLDRRYIVLFSLKNNCIWEIDTKEMKVNQKKCFYSDQCIQEVSKLYNERGKVLFERKGIDRLIFEERLLNANMEKKRIPLRSIGMSIQKKMIKG